MYYKVLLLLLIKLTRRTLHARCCSPAVPFSAAAASLGSVLRLSPGLDKQRLCGGEEHFPVETLQFPRDEQLPALDAVDGHIHHGRRHTREQRLVVHLSVLWVTFDTGGQMCHPDKEIGQRID